MSYQKYETKYEFKPNKFIFVPTQESRDYGINIKKELERKWEKPTYYHHYLSKGHVKAIKKHLHQDWFIRVDLANFFYNVTQTKITRALVGLLKDYEKARDFAKKSTVTSKINNKKIFHIPYGFIQSPIIASICLHNSKLGQYLDSLQSNGYYVSVYVDDIIISGKNNQSYEGIIDNLKNFAQKSNFPINEDKLEFSVLEITAFNIELSKTSSQISQERMNEFIKVLNDEKTSVLSKIAIKKYISDVKFPK